MSHVAHELHEEFPEKAEAIHTLKTANAHFARIAEEYHELNRAIHRIETDVEPADDATLEDLKKKRLSLKDEIAQFLAAA
ncbi:YdcH family protein [Methylocystis sp. 9N]|uniref:YdcH family protein n=1 Tax=Methylocystis borbori TaxID=3118750 RepID=A0ABU7XIC2_9HYPH